MGIYNVISFFGLFGLILVAWLVSEDKKRMNWRVVGWGVGIQILIGVFVFNIPAGAKLFLALNDLVVKVLNASTAGAQFVFGRLALAPGQINSVGEESIGFILAFQGFPTIIFFSALVSILYFLNIMPFIIRGFAYVFTKLMKISGAESLVAATNIFMGIESTLTVRPHLKDMTRSELCTILTVGMATVASNVLALYVFCLHSQFSTIAAHLISASLLSAPAGLVMAKIIVPEKEIPKTLGMHVHPSYEKDNNLFEAIINGANAGVRMIVGITALLIAVLGLVALADIFLGFVGKNINAIAGLHFEWSLKNILGYLFYPFTLMLGVPIEDAGTVAKIIGERLIVTEVVSYQDLAQAISKHLLIYPRSIVITTYALCGFAHLASMAIFVGGISALVPSKARALAEVALRALFAATLTCLMTACIAGIFFTEQSILFR